MPSLKTALIVAGLASSAAASSCTVKSYSDMASAVKSCSSITVDSFTVPAGKTLDLKKLKSSAKVTFTGTIKFGYKEWKGPLVQFGGSKVTIDCSGCLFDGQGSRWWDTKGTNGGKTKPKFFACNSLDSSTVKNLKVKNAPAHVFSVSGDGNTYDKIHIDMADANKLSGGKKLGHNTDAFDVGSVNGLIIQNSWVSNQDDCLAINSGKKVQFLKNTCIGGHGISVGSVGDRDDNVVDNVLVQGCTVNGGENGLRIKTKADASSGSVSDIRWLSNTFEGTIDNCIVIRQDYANSGSTGTAGKHIKIDGVTLNGLKQSSGSCSKAITTVTCGNCSGFTFKDVKLSGKKGKCSGYSKTLYGCS